MWVVTEQARACLCPPGLPLLVGTGRHLEDRFFSGDPMMRKLLAYGIWDTTWVPWAG